MPQRECEALSSAVSRSGFSDETKSVLNILAWSSVAWDSGLIQKLADPPCFKHVVWAGKGRAGGDTGYSVYIFDAFIRPAADFPIPPVCVVIDRDGRVAAWSVVAPWSSGFLTAALDEKDVLTITTVANWFYGVGVY